MFTFSQEKLVSLGASITTEEIKQQPDLWDETSDGTSLNGDIGAGTFILDNLRIEQVPVAP
jgi:hypothetical protein